MQNLRIEDAEKMKLEIQNELSRSMESRYDHRLHGVLLGCNGMNCYEIADLLGRNPCTIQHWFRSFNKDGFVGLMEDSRPGRPPRLDETQIHRIDEDLRINPRNFGYNQNMWDGKLLSHHIKITFDVNLATRQCQRLFNKLDFRRRKPRQEIAGGDPVAQNEYKKKSLA